MLLKQLRMELCPDVTPCMVFFVVVHAVDPPMADAVEGAPPTTVVANAVTVAHRCPTDGDTSAAGYVDHC